jgi:hypothetical protein
MGGGLGIGWSTLVVVIPMEIRFLV